MQNNVGIIVRAAHLIDFADRYAFIASVALFMIFVVKKQRTNAKSKGRGLAICRRRKIYAMNAVELGSPGRNLSNFEDRFLRTARYP